MSKSKILIYFDVVYTQAKSCWGAVQIGRTLFILGPFRRPQGWRLELFTPLHRFRFRRAKHDGEK